jgi:glycosyltransferase involved in cell wall biosynthesis
MPNQLSQRQGELSRVLVFSHMFPNAAVPIGGTFVWEQVKALRKLGVKVFLVSPTPWVVPVFGRFVASLRRFRVVPRQVDLEGCVVEYPKVLTFPTKRTYIESFLYYLGCRNLIRKLVKEHKIDIIHAHMMSPDGLAAIRIGREMKIPVVCTVHGSDIRIYPRRSRAMLWLTKWGLKYADHVIAVSAELRQQALSIAPARVSVIRNGGDANNFRPQSKMDARLKLQLPREAKIILFVGHLRPVKGIEFLLHALAQLDDDTRLWLVGEGESKDALWIKADELGVLHRCHFVGTQPHTQIPLWLSAADCLVLPSLSEGLPTILIESMFCKTPIVATKVGGVPEIVEDERTGLLVDNENPSQLADAIRRLLSDTDFAKCLADQGYAEAIGRLTWDANAELTVTVYKQVLQQRLRADRQPSNYPASAQE